MIIVSCVKNDNQTITKFFRTNVELNDWLRYSHSHFSPFKYIYIRFKDGHNVEYVHMSVGPWTATYAA